MMCNPLFWEDSHATSSLLPKIKNVHPSKKEIMDLNLIITVMHICTVSLFPNGGGQNSIYLNYFFNWMTKGSNPSNSWVNERHSFLFDFSPNPHFEMHNNYYKCTEHSICNNSDTLPVTLKLKELWTW